MPSFLGFFAGKRFVPIATAGAAFVAGLAIDCHLANSSSGNE